MKRAPFWLPTPTTPSSPILPSAAKKNQDILDEYKKKLKDLPEKERELWRVFDRTSFEDGLAEISTAVRESGEIISTQMYLPMPDRGSTTADFFNPLVHHAEQMILENKQPYPIERTLLTSGMTLAGVESLHRGTVVETPEMAVRYTGPKESTFWRD